MILPNPPPTNFLKSSRCKDTVLMNTSGIFQATLEELNQPILTDLQQKALFDKRRKNSVNKNYEKRGIPQPLEFKHRTKNWYERGGKWDGRYEDVLEQAIEMDANELLLSCFFKTKGQSSEPLQDPGCANNPNLHFRKGGKNIPQRKPYSPSCINLSIESKLTGWTSSSPSGQHKSKATGNEIIRRQQKERESSK